MMTASAFLDMGSLLARSSGARYGAGPRRLVGRWWPPGQLIYQSPAPGVTRGGVRGRAWGPRGGVGRRSATRFGGKRNAGAEETSGAPPPAPLRQNPPARPPAPAPRR